MDIYEEKLNEEDPYILPKLAFLHFSKTFVIGEEKQKRCHPERGEAESRDLRISLSFAVNFVPGSFDSAPLRSYVTALLP